MLFPRIAEMSAGWGCYKMNENQTSIIRMRDNQSSYFDPDDLKKEREHEHGRVICLDTEKRRYFVKKDTYYGFEEDEFLLGKPQKIWQLLVKYDGVTLPELLEKTKEGETAVFHLGGDKDAARLKNEKKYPFYKITDKEFDEGQGESGCPKSFRLETSNLMGVLTLTDGDGFSLTLQVESRFDRSEKQPFLLYLLSKVCDFEIAENNAESRGESPLGEILLFLAFRRALEKAADVGLYKKYERVKYNDLKFRGRLDLARHLRLNYPVMDKIAYSRREITFDHCVNHLIRHAAAELEKNFAEFKATAFRGNGAGKTVREFVHQLEMNTPGWQPGGAAVRQLLRQRDALEPVRHSYFAEAYEELRVLSRMILEKDVGMPYGSVGGQVSGVLFDGAWLWEEYLATVLEPLEFVHARVWEEGGIYAFKEDEIKQLKQRRCYPDFYCKGQDGQNGGVVLDAKYKRGEVIGDSQQLLCYMLLTGARHVGLIYPPPSSADNQDDELKVSNNEFQMFTVNQKLDKRNKGGYKWQSYQFGKWSDSENEFEKIRVFMEGEEENLKKWVKKVAGVD